jgi:hypothetical protein
MNTATCCPAPDGLFLVRGLAYHNGTTGEVVTEAETFPVVCFRTERQGDDTTTVPLVLHPSHAGEALSAWDLDLVHGPADDSAVWRTAVRPTAEQLESLKAEVQRLALAKLRRGVRWNMHPDQKRALEVA